MTFSYRKATSADFDLTFYIKSCSIKSYVDAIWGWDEQVQLAFHKKEFNPEVTQIILDADRKAIGLLITTESTESVYIRSILIHQASQGQGIGSTIIADIIERCRLAEKRIELQVYKVNQRAKSLYERLGFTVVGQTDTHYQMNQG